METGNQKIKLRKFVEKAVLAFFVFFSWISIFAQQKFNVKYYHEIQGKDAIIYADNDEWMPVSSKFTFEVQNMKSTLNSGEIVLLPAKSKKIEITRFSKINPNAANRFSYQTMTNFGNALQTGFDKDYVYWLPFETGKTQLIFQGYRGKLSHQEADALDFDLKTGEKIYAAREGLAVEVVENNTKNCPDISCAKFNNRIIIMHSDGTFAEYSHLKFGGAEVNAGDEIEKGQFIGYSGNTGYSTGPHLHFSVFINRVDGKRDYIKTKFKTSANEPELLQEKKNYTRNY